MLLFLLPPKEEVLKSKNAEGSFVHLAQVFLWAFMGWGKNKKP